MLRRWLRCWRNCSITACVTAKRLAQIKLQVQAQQLVELRWQDQGLGIAAEPRDQVFQRFVRLEEHRHRSQADGAGLGLALCVALMQAMGGSIALEPVSSLQRVQAFFVAVASALRQISVQNRFHVIKESSFEQPAIGSCGFCLLLFQLSVVERTEHHHGPLVAALAQFLQALHAAHARHQHIKKNQLDLEFSSSARRASPLL